MLWPKKRTANEHSLSNLCTVRDFVDLEGVHSHTSKLDCPLECVNEFLRYRLSLGFQSMCIRVVIPILVRVARHDGLHHACCLVFQERGSILHIDSDSLGISVTIDNDTRHDQGGASQVKDLDVGQANGDLGLGDSAQLAAAAGLVVEAWLAKDLFKLTALKSYNFLSFLNCKDGAAAEG
jgi:hypothetical protein